MEYLTDIYMQTWEGGNESQQVFFWQVDAEYLHLLAMHVIKKCDKLKHGFWPIVCQKNSGSNVALLVKRYSAIEAVAQLPSGAKGWKTAICPHLLTT